MCLILVLPLEVVDVWLLLLELLVSCDVLPTWVLPLSSQLSFITWFCTLFMAHLGYLHLTRASLCCCNSSSKSPSVVQTVLVLLVSVPMTLYLAEVMMTIPLHMLVSMGWFAIHLNVNGIVCLWFEQGIKKGIDHCLDYL